MAAVTQPWVQWANPQTRKLESGNQNPESGKLFSIAFDSKKVRVLIREHFWKFEDEYQKNKTTTFRSHLDSIIKKRY